MALTRGFNTREVSMHGVDADGETWNELAVDSLGMPYGKGMVWNSDTLAWEKMQQPVLEATTGNLNVAMEDVEALLTTIRDHYTKAFDYDGSGNMIYIGIAAIGSTKSSASWQIKKLTYDGSNRLTDIQWADGNNNYDNIWNNRASLSYS